MTLLSGDVVTTVEIYRDAFKPARDAATIRRYLASPLAIRIRVEKEKLLVGIEAEERKSK